MNMFTEDSFQIARFLYENGHTSWDRLIQRGEVIEALKNYLGDFDIALDDLSNRGYCRIVTLGGDQGLFYLLPAGIDFVERCKKERFDIGLDAEQLLKYLVKNQAPDLPFSSVDVVIRALGWDEDRYLAAAQILGDESFVTGQYADGNPYWTISVLPEGRKAVRSNFILPSIASGAIYTGNITTNINGSNNVLSIGSLLSAANQTIQIHSVIPSDQKEEIKDLLEQLNQQLRVLPEEYADDAEAVAEMAKSLVENAAKEKPNRRINEVTAEGLKKAAENISKITPLVLTTVLEIISFIQKIPPR